MLTTLTALKVQARNPVLNSAFEQLDIARAAYEHTANDWTRYQLVRQEQQVLVICRLLRLL